MVRNLNPYIQPLYRFYSLAKEYFDIKARIWSLLLSHPQAVKTLVPGRLLVLNHAEQTNVIGILLAVDTSGKEKTFSVLLLDGGAKSGSADLKLNHYLSLAAKGVDCTGCLAAGHQVIQPR
jgi:hypothetical protein